MNWKATVAFIAIAAAIVVFYFKDVEKVEQEKQAEKEREELILADAEEIVAIALERPGAETIAAVREGEEWRLTAPVAWPADKFAWDAVASSLASAKIRRTFPDEGESLSDDDLENWGLTPPHITVRATLREGSEEFSYSFGNTLPGADTSVYGVSSALPDKALVVPKAVVSNASKELSQLREMKYLNVHFERDEPNRIEVSNKDIDLIAERIDGDNWTIHSYGKLKGDPTSLRKYVEKLGTDTIKILDDVDDAKLAEAGLADDQIASATRYKIGFGDTGDSKTFYVGKYDPAEGGHYGRREGTRNLFVVSADFFEGQPKTIDELRPKRIVANQKWNAEVVSATSNGKPLFHLVKEDFKWRMVSPHSATAEREVVDRMLDALNEYKVGSYINTEESEADFGMDVPILSMTIEGEKGIETLHLGNHDEVGGIYAAWDDLPDRFTIDQGILERLLLNPMEILTPGERDRLSTGQSAAEGDSDVLDLTGDSEGPPAGSSAEESAEPDQEAEGEAIEAEIVEEEAAEGESEAEAEVIEVVEEEEEAVEESGDE